MADGRRMAYFEAVAKVRFDVENGISNEGQQCETWPHTWQGNRTSFNSLLERPDCSLFAGVIEASRN